jgi:hypothetical protein
MTEDDAARGLPTCPATYLLREGIPVCTTCGAVIGGTGADQIRHSTWHTTLAALFAVADQHDHVDQHQVTLRSAPIAAGKRARSSKTDLSRLPSAFA